MTEPTDTLDATTLEAELRRSLGDDTVEVHELERLTGGSSREIWALTLRRGGASRALILRRDPPGEVRSDGAGLEVRAMSAAHAAGVPVPEIVAVTSAAAHGLLLERVDGEALPRQVLRADELGEARAALAFQCGEALGALHSATPPDGVPRIHRLDEYRDVLDELGQDRPVLELAYRWLIDHRPPPRPDVLAHGDFRLGNLIVGPEGLRSVLDWESAHLSSPLEDLGWLCVPAWRFGGPHPVGGFGTVGDLLAGYAASGGSADVTTDEMNWAIVLGTWVWAVGCLQQAERHRSGATRSIDLAAVGRRVTENEADLLDLIHPDGPAHPLPPPTEADAEARSAALIYGPPALDELLEAVRDVLRDDLLPGADGRDGYQIRVCVNVLEMAVRELRLGAAIERNQVTDAELAAEIRAGTVDPEHADVVSAVFTRTAQLLDVVSPRRANRFRDTHSGGSARQ